MNVILKHLKATVSLNSFANKISNSVLLLAVACISLFYSNSIFGQTTYSNSGTFYYTVPAGVTKIKVECWGAGGAGGGNPYTSDGGGGGGAGTTHGSEECANSDIRVQQLTWNAAEKRC